MQKETRPSAAMGPTCRTLLPEIQSEVDLEGGQGGPAQGSGTDTLKEAPEITLRKGQLEGSIPGYTCGVDFTSV